MLMARQHLAIPQTPKVKVTMEFQGFFLRHPKFNQNIIGSVKNFAHISKRRDTQKTKIKS